MYTGTQKKAVVIKADKNSIFESAYFILKDDIKSIGQSEMIREANKILKNTSVGIFFSDGDKTTPKNNKTKALIGFLLGALVSFVVCTLLFVFAK